MHQLRANRRNHKHAWQMCPSPRALSRISPRRLIELGQPRLLQIQQACRPQQYESSCRMDCNSRLPTSWSRGFIQIPYGINTYPYYIQRDTCSIPSYRPQRSRIELRSGTCRWGTKEGFSGQGDFGLDLVGVTTLQDGTPLTPTDSAGSDFCGGAGCSGNGLNATGNFCPGMGPANVLTSGSMESRNE